MGVWENIVNWVEEKIGVWTQRLRDWVTSKLEALITEIRVWKLNAKLWLADFTSTALGFWLFLGALIITVVVTTYIASTETWQAFKLLVDERIAKLKLRLGTTLGRLGYSTMLSFHNLAMLFIPEYKDAWNEIYDGLASLGEELRLGVAGINSAVRAARTVIASALTLAGVPAGGAYAIADERLGEWLDNLEDRLERYTRNPHYLFLDIDEELVAPAMSEMDDTVYQMLSDIDRFNTDLANKTNEIIDLKTSIDGLVDSMPDEIRDAMQETWGAISKRFDVFQTEYLDPFLEYSAGLDEEFDRLISNNALRIGEGEALIAFPGSLLAQIATMVEPIRGWQARLVARIAAMGQSSDVAGTALEYHEASTYLADVVHERARNPRSYAAREMPISSQQREALADVAFEVWYSGGL